MFPDNTMNEKAIVQHHFTLLLGVYKKMCSRQQDAFVIPRDGKSGIRDPAAPCPRRTPTVTDSLLLWVANSIERVVCLTVS